MAKGETAVVAGATGYLGGYVCMALHAAGYRVRALVRDPARLGAASPFCDEVVIGEATRPETLGGLFDDATIAFSSIGVRHMRRRPTFWEVDRDANLHLVDAAERSGVTRFIFTSVLDGDVHRGHFPIAEAREQVVDRLASSQMAAIVLRPTGFFNDMSEIYAMAERGRVWLVGDGAARLNPIHGADIADEVVRQLLLPGRGPREVPLGGPDVLSMREIGQLAFSTLGRRERYGRIPASAIDWFGRLAYRFNVNLGGLAMGIALVAAKDAVAPAVGRRRLGDFFAELSSASEFDSNGDSALRGK